MVGKCTSKVKRCRFTFLMIQGDPAKLELKLLQETHEMVLLSVSVQASRSFLEILSD
jgi:hypothetical protein